MIFDLNYRISELIKKLKKDENWEFHCGDKYIKIHKNLHVVSSNFLVKGKCLTYIPLDYRIKIFREYNDPIPFTKSVIIEDDKGQIIIRMLNPQEVTYLD